MLHFTHVTKSLALIITLGLIASCSKSQPDIVADSIFSGGTIITMNDAMPSAQALAIKDGKIIALGKRAEIE